MKIGYARVSTPSQRNDRQVWRLASEGVDHDHIYMDVGVSGRTMDRPGWETCLESLQSGDKLFVTSLDRMCRSVKHFLKLMDQLHEKNVQLCVLDQGIDTSGHAGKFILTLLAALAELETEIIRERTREGLSAARSRGRKGGRKLKFSEQEAQEIRMLYDERTLTVEEIAQKFSTSRRTIYDYLKRSTNVK